MRGQTALYRLFSAEDALLYVGISKQFGDRWHQHAWQKPWWPEVHHQTITWYDTYKEADEAETAAIRAEHPAYNIAKVPRPDSPDSPGRPSRSVCAADLGDLDEMGRELVAAQAEMSPATGAKARRRKLVMQARDELGWTKYRIAAVLGVKGPTVDAIIEAAERAKERQ